MGGVIQTLFPSNGPDYGPISNIGGEAAGIAKGELTQKPTPFQQSMIAAYKKSANANMDSYLAKFKAAGGKDVSDMSAVTDEQAQIMGQKFLDENFTSGVEALGLAAHDYNAAAGILTGQQQQTMSAIGSVAAIIGSIF